ncbi:hypothetical protein PAGU1579_03620 [Veillonella tobetsuensis]|uniref:Uncharacterized protein n=1 Tax=Veillonella tobetsuensis TaxID=1110546 RepID=A0A480B5U1_9FIRM|nr:hypothetical protein PAGU1578_12780 [Veillonella tobetsuensis]GCL68593.1 hypothetical protein PAGU1579_03620 [Veillonella tobetsuensis]
MHALHLPINILTDITKAMLIIPNGIFTTTTLSIKRFLVLCKIRMLLHKKILFTGT